MNLARQVRRYRPARRKFMRVVSLTWLDEFAPAFVWKTTNGYVGEVYAGGLLVDRATYDTNADALRWCRARFCALLSAARWN